MQIELTYKQAILIREMAKKLGGEARTESHIINKMFTDKLMKSKDMEQYYLEEQDRLNKLGDLYTGIVFAMRDATGTI